MMELLTNDQRRKVNNGTAEERTAAIQALEPGEALAGACHAGAECDRRAA